MFHYLQLVTVLHMPIMADFYNCKNYGRIVDVYLHLDNTVKSYVVEFQDCSASHTTRIDMDPKDLELRVLTK